MQGKDLCEACAKLPQASTNESTRVHDEIDLWYGRIRWIRFRDSVLARRPICQRIVKSEPCHNAATLVHHLQSPRMHPDLFTDWDNVLALCESCHTPEAGTPHWRRDVDYVYVPFDKWMVS